MTLSSPRFDTLNKAIYFCSRIGFTLRIGRINSRRSRDDQLQRNLETKEHGFQQQADIRQFRRNTANRNRRIAACELNYQGAETLSDRELAKLLLQQSDSSKPKYIMPDYDWVNSELARPGVTLQLLWLEYCDKCISSGEIPYQLTQFKKYYREYAVQTKATMHLLRKPGELMEVDWAGQTAAMIDDTTGEVIDAYVFVAVLPYSEYGYVEAFLNQAQPSWIAGHVNAYEYFGGVTRILVPDNLKTGVTKHTKSEIVLNRSYQEMAEHYGTAVIPTRVRAPKDKATVEGMLWSSVISFRNERIIYCYSSNLIMF